MPWRRLEATNWTVGIGHIGLLTVAAESESRIAWAVCLWLVGAISFFAWMGNVRRHQSIAGTPTSRVASAAQGYVELEGTGRNLPDLPLLTRLRQRPCLWYQFDVQRKTGKHWRSVESGRSDAPFLLVDATGPCMIQPDRAEVIASHAASWTQGDRRYSERWIEPEDTVYAIGHFASVGGRNALIDEQAAVRQLLADWKNDPARLRDRFDLDANGEVDMAEWALARRQARREVERHAHEKRQEAPMHVMTRPPDGRLFLVSNLEPSKLARRYSIWAWVQGTLFLAGIGAGTALWFAR